MYTKVFQLLAAFAVALPAVHACVGKDALPQATRTITNSKTIEVAAGQTFDGQNARYERGSGACSEQSEGGQSDTVFLLRKGATLRNAIIGKNQAEGVYCLGGGCTIENVWFEDVCEDAISIIIGGGVYSASDKIIQHNGCGTVSISNFYARNYGNVYRACGTCTKCKRTVNMSGVSAYGGGELAGMNKDSGDVATLSNICTDAKTRCQLYSSSGSKVGIC
ncbi:pectate lyase F [Diaporthe helianthi]|uniref:Pectate lyase n=1 Tax=Diaporthe helianthi TaxID=158607 RepID=A0A2P5HQ21_DIAHE|nr:pectate lyase F [Diaporthe helianthi]